MTGRASNCDKGLGLVGGKDRCPHCNQFHLTPGYCQALDPVQMTEAQKAAWIKRRAAEIREEQARLDD